MSTILIKNGQIVREEGIKRGDIFVEDGIITELSSPARRSFSEGGTELRKASGEAPLDSAPCEEPHSRKAETIDATNLLIFPGLIDCHVHFRDPGMEEAEDMMTGSLAALSGGVTTVCDMPNTNPATVTKVALEEKIEKAEQVASGQWQVGSGHSLGCDIRFFFGVANKDHLEELGKVMDNDTPLRGHVCGVKLYMGHSTGDQKVEEGIEEEIFKICADKDLVLVCHCEDESVIQKNKQEITNHEIKSHSEIRSVEAAVKSTTYAIELGKKYGTKLHIAHVSTSDELELIRIAKKSGQPITCEVTPHHLFLNIDDYETLGTLAKMNPPLRTKDHCKALWKGVLDGTVDCISSDHAPHTLKSKQTENPLDAPSGVPGVATMLPLLISKGLTPADILRTCFTNPNHIFSLEKPGITVGKPANLCLVNPTEKWTISGANLSSKCKWTPYEGWGMQGKVVRVIC